MAQKSAFSLDLDAKQVNALVKKAVKVQETKPLMQRIGRVLTTDVDMNFRRGQDPDGKPWAPLEVRDGQPLRDTGRFQRSFSYDASEEEVVVGTNWKWALIHHLGATIKPKKGRFLVFQGPNGPIFAKKVVIPARRVIGIGSRQVDKINGEMDRWVQEILND